MTDPLNDLRRADAHARWQSAESLALRPEAAAQLAVGPVLLAGWMDADDEDDDPGYEVVNGVAVVPVEGALMDRAGWWWDGYDAIQKRIEAAHVDKAVRAVLFDLSSPGGMVAGLFDCMRALRAARLASKKRTVAWVGSGAFSAAYGLASTCDEIVISDTAGVGSVGVIASLMSRVDQLAQDGVNVRVVASGTEKTDGHHAVTISDGAEARLRARVDELAGMFFSEVGVGRPSLSPDVLRALDGGVRYGRASIAAGLADRIAGRSALLAELAAGASTAAPKKHPMAPMKERAPAGAARASTEPRADSGPTHAVGSRVRVAIDPPHMQGHAGGEVREAVLTYAYGIAFDGMESMGVHHWYVESELKAEAAARLPLGLASPTASTSPATTTNAPARGTTAAPFGRASRTTMNEQQFAALSAAFSGETDPDKIIAAATGLASRLAGAEASLAKMTEERATLAARADAAEKRATAMERDAEISAAKAAGQWTPALDGFLGSLSVSQLRAWRETAPRAVPEGEHKQPGDATPAAGQLPLPVATLVARASTDGWRTLSAAEKHAVSTHDPKLAARLKAAR